MPEETKIIVRLLDLSKAILNEIDELAKLSYYGKEDTKDFLKHVSYIKKYLEQERIVLNNISLENLMKLFKDLDKYDDNSDAYERIYTHIDDLIAVLLDEQEEKESDNSYEESENEESEDEDQEDDEDNEIIELLANYEEEENESQKYCIFVLNNMSTIVIKKMLSRINNTIADNKQDSKYKKNLIKGFQKFKYFYFTLDNELEMLGASYNFDIDRIPMPYKFNTDVSRILYNECINILDKLYEIKEVSYSTEDMEETLFEIMMLEECLNQMDAEYIDKLLDLSNELEKHYGTNYFGTIGKKKVLSKKN